MTKLYEKSEITFALVWIALYVVIMNIALQFCGGFDDLAAKNATQLMIPVACILVLAVAVTLWITKNGLAKKYSLSAFKGRMGAFLWFLPLAIMSCTNLKNGVALSAPLLVSVLMAVNLALGGYVEEVIFRGFLFRAMEKDNLTAAVIVSAVTFGMGHIVNLANTADTLGVLLQICYAMVIGFLYTIIVWKGGSLWPCIASHMFVNGTSVFARDQGLFGDLMTSLFGSAATQLTELGSALLIILISGGYALWLYKKA